MTQLKAIVIEKWRSGQHGIQMGSTKINTPEHLIIEFIHRRCNLIFKNIWTPKTHFIKFLGYSRIKERASYKSSSVAPTNLEGNVLKFIVKNTISYTTQMSSHIKIKEVNVCHSVTVFTAWHKSRHTLGKKISQLRNWDTMYVLITYLYPLYSVSLNVLHT